MNVKEFFQKISGYIIAFFVGVVAIILRISHQRRSSNGTKNPVSELQGTTDRLSDTTERLRDNTDRLSNTNGRFKETNSRFETLIERIEKEGIDN